MRNKNSRDVVEKGNKFYWHFWHLANEGGRGIWDNILLFIRKCFIPLYYILFLSLHFAGKKSKSKKYPIISVGNLTLGGTGKSPCVEFLIKKLLNKKRKAGILTKGYGRKAKDSKKVVFSKIKEDIAVMDIGDEPYLFSKHFPSVPIFISRDRAKSLLDAEEKRESDVFIMDDGFQYQHIEKDLEILLINKRNPFGNGSLFPAGFLREPISSVKRAALIILTHSDESTEDGDSKKVFSTLSKQAPKVPVLESVYKPLYFEDFKSGKKYRAEELAGKRFLSLSSVADPLSFEKSFEKLKINTVKKARFPDHYIYKPADIEWLFSLAKKENIDFIVTTEKDYVRFPKGVKFPVPVLCLMMNFKIIKGEKVLDDMINEVLGKYKI